ncbi:MAG: hypothetical protein ABIT09_00845, partial [Croceibacterium sp.]
FLGKLFAMLAMSLVGIVVWAAAGAAALAYFVGGGLGAIPTPAVGWPLFLILVPCYFAMSYLLIGGVFLGIGGQASTVREVQTLSMPVTMAQVLLFFFANLAMADDGGWITWAATLFPFTSPYAMLARAAMAPALWPHALGLAWDLAWVGVCIRVGTTLFRKRVMQSGPRRVKNRARWGRSTGPTASISSQSTGSPVPL